MGGLQNQGLAGLTHQAGKRESARADLNTLNQLHNLKQEEEKQEQQAALIEQQYYDGIRTEADKLLSGDRKRINNKAASIQSEIRKNIKLFGGSRKKFMANGGMAMIGDYKNKVLDSDEFQTYKENKVNMEKILDLKQKNLGHLLTPQDQLALKNYNKDGFGKITYAGLMSEIQIPDKDLFDYGSQIGPSDIVATGSNTTKLLSNFMLEYPDLEPPNPFTSEGMTTLRNYVIAKGYGGRGSNKDRLNYERQSRKTSQEKAAQGVKRKYSISGSLQAGISQQISIPISDIKSDSLVMNNFWDGLIGDIYTSDLNVRASQNPEIGETIMDLGSYNPFNDPENGYTPRGARKLPRKYSEKFLLSRFGTSATIEGNKLKGFTIPAGEAYTADGTALTKDISSGDYQIMDTFIGWKSDDGSKRHVIVDPKDEDNKLDEKKQLKMHHTEKGSEPPVGSPSVFVMVRDKDYHYDDDYYIEIPYGSVLSQASFKEEMGASDDITDMMNENKATKSEIDSGTDSANIRKQSEINPEINVNAPEFSSEVFNFQSSEYNTGDENKRTNLRKAFYLAGIDSSNNPEGLQKSIEDNMFRNFFAYNGLSDQLTGNLNDNQILDRILQTNTGTPQENERNAIFINKIKNYLKEIYSTKQ
jgi:hypothetical protein